MGHSERRCLWMRRQLWEDTLADGTDPEMFGLGREIVNEAGELGL